MEPDKGNALVRVAVQFEGHDLAVIEINGVFYWSARQLAVALGYARADAIAEQVRDEWADEATEGTDYRVSWQEHLVDGLDAGETWGARYTTRDVLLGRGRKMVRSGRTVDQWRHLFAAIEEISGQPMPEVEAGEGDAEHLVVIARAFIALEQMSADQLARVVERLGRLAGREEADHLWFAVEDSARMLAKRAGLRVVGPEEVPSPIEEERVAPLADRLGAARELRELADGLLAAGAIDAAQHTRYLLRAAALLAAGRAS